MKIKKWTFKSPFYFAFIVWLALTFLSDGISVLLGTHTPITYEGLTLRPSPVQSTLGGTQNFLKNF
jgi:hypothetical protein